MRLFFETLWVALSLYSTLPVPRVAWNEKNMRYALCLFPAAGAAAGGLLFCWIWLCGALSLPAPLRAVLAVLLPLAVTGGIHMDGFCDTVDALSAHRPPQEGLRILKDPHLGAFGALGCGCYLLLCFALWQSLPPSLPCAGVLGGSMVLSRALSGLYVLLLPCAKDAGLVAAFAGKADKGRATAALAGLAAVCALAMLCLSPPLGGVCLAAALAAFLFCRRTALSRFGGVTGDLAGYFLQVCEAAMLAACVLLEVVL